MGALEWTDWGCEITSVTEEIQKEITRTERLILMQVKNSRLTANTGLIMGVNCK